MKAVLLGLALVSTLTASAVEAKGSMHIDFSRTTPTQRQREDARWIKVKIDRCVARIQSNKEKLWNGGEDTYFHHSDDEIRQTCLAIISMRG